MKNHKTLNTKNSLNAGEQFVESWIENARALEDNGMYRAEDEHDACGVGLVATIDGEPRRSVVVAGIDALKAVWHRGAVDADGKTGDGAGIHVQIPQNFFKEHIARTGHEPSEGRLAVGMVFLPKNDFSAQETCRTIVETEILNFGYYIYGWRQVPVDTSIIGEKANATRPEIEQIMIDNRRGVTDDDFERDLYVIRRRIERRLLEEHINDFYICTLSCRSIIYKGMFLAEQLTHFYPDLLDERFVSNFAIYHQRYSTNTFPTWRLAQPFRMLAHNGEINTVRGNVNWMKSHEQRLESESLGEYASEIKPIVQSGSSDSAALDAAFEALVRAGRSAPLAKVLMIPDAWSPEDTKPEKHRALLNYSNCVMEPWDGPAAICATDGRWVVAGMDRNGLRPLRYTVTTDGLLIVGSEAGMVPVSESKVIEKGRIGPGQLVAIDFNEGKLYHDHEMKDLLADAHPYEEWVKNIVPMAQTVETIPGLVEAYDKDELRRRMVSVGFSTEDLELILHPMGEDGKEAIGSMGDDTPSAVLSEKYRGLHHFFRQNFSQVTNPPIDSLREKSVMTLTTRLGNLGNVFEQTEAQTNIFELDSPVLTTALAVGISKHLGDTVVEVDCTFDADGGEDALRVAIDRIRQ
ncbi:MAG: glutamate synthase large subunit, partial [Alphaproteobacteria bacterium]|nr:glutamate synthase large subunit [Alphaproteobacteria bacterium]